MSLTGLLSEKVTWLKFTPGAPDAHGVPVEGWIVQDEIPAYVEQTASVEVLQGRDTVTADWLVVVAPPSKIAATDRLVVRRKTLEVVGDPALFTMPTTGPHHIELRCRGVTG